MKKNVMMRVASALLVAVLMTTCAISGTFAKYTTTDTATDNARVAKWGVTVDVTGEAFEKAYNDTALAAGTKVVSTTDVVAPGTNGPLASVEINGNPEVMVDVTVDVDLVLTGWTINVEGVDTVYCPLVFTVGGEEIKMGGAIDTLAKLEEAVEAKFNALAKNNVEVGTPLNATLEASWAWAFEGNNAYDTKLGDLPVAPQITFTCTVTVTQVD